MKKNIINSVILMFTFVLLTACGNNNKDDRPYAFFNARTPVIIVNNGLTYDVIAQLLIADVPAPGQVVYMKAFNYKYGRVLSSREYTDGNGNATFLYQAPSGTDYELIRGQDLVIQAVYFDPTPPESNETAAPEVPDILAQQDFVLQFR